MTIRTQLAAVAQRAVTSVYGEPVTYAYSGGGSSDVRAIHHAAVEVVLDGTEAGGWTATRPMLTIELSRLTAAPVDGDTWTIASGDTFEVVDVQLDGHGVAKIHGVVA